MVLFSITPKLGTPFVNLYQVVFIRSKSKKSIITDAFLSDVSNAPLFFDNKLDMPKSDSINPVSVGTVINKTMSAESLAILARWQKRKRDELGFIGFREYISNIKRIGFEMHDVLSKHLYVEKRETLIVPAHLKNYFNSLAPVLKEIEEPICVEKTVSHPLLNYHGRTDGVVKIDGVHWLVEWKTIHEMRRVTSIREAYDAPLQLSAYVAAYNTTLEPQHHVKRGLLVYAYPTGEPADVVPLTGDNLTSAWNSWLIRLGNYFTLLKMEQDNVAKKMEQNEEELRSLEA